MVNVQLITVLIIGVLQVCRANPIAVEEENDVTKLFSADELQRAKSAGLSDNRLVSGKSVGLTLDDMIQLDSLFKRPKQQNVTIFDLMTETCEILVPGHKSASDGTSVQVSQLLSLVSLMPGRDQLTFIRTNICGYLSQPQLHSFGPEFFLATKYRYLKIKAENTTGMNRVKIAKRMCCIDQLGDLLGPSMISNLTDDEMKQFDEHWTDFETSNELKKVCDFLEAKYPNDDECFATESSESSESSESFES